MFQKPRMTVGAAALAVTTTLQAQHMNTNKPEVQPVIDKAMPSRTKPDGLKQAGLHSFTNKRTGLYAAFAVDKPRLDVLTISQRSLIFAQMTRSLASWSAQMQHHKILSRYHYCSKRHSRCHQLQLLPILQYHSLSSNQALLKACSVSSSCCSLTTKGVYTSHQASRENCTTIRLA